MIAWSIVEDALRAWVLRASGLPASQVIWENQPGPRPPKTFITLANRSIQRLGQDWLKKSPTPGAPSGNELTVTAQGVREMRLTIQCFGTGAIGNAGPVAILDRVVSCRHLPSYNHNLNTAGIGVGSIGAVLLINGVDKDAQPLPRAVVDVTITLSAEVSETTTFVETVGVTPIVTP
jgi:hypothetical protein